MSVSNPNEQYNLLLLIILKLKLLTLHNMNIVIVGTGYVGLVTGVGFAEQGHNVSFIDLDSKKINRLASKELPFFEPGLDEYFSKDDNFNRM